MLILACKKKEFYYGDEPDFLRRRQALFGVRGGFACSSSPGGGLQL
jgi:hypothetical protein